MTFPASRAIDVYTLDLEIGADDVSFFRDFLSPDECARADRFRFPIHRRRFVGARAQLRMVVGAALGIDARAVVFRYGSHGKPAVDGIEFNLAHSGSVGLIALAVSEPVGIDVERVRPVDDLDGLAATCLSAAELHALRALHAGQRLEAFYRGWTRKEAYLKATGDGLSAPLDRFTVDLQAQTAAPIVFQDDAARGAWLTFPLDVPAGYAGALAVREGWWNVRHQPWPLDVAELTGGAYV